MSYSSEVLADSPVVYYDFTSGTTSFAADAGSSQPSLTLNTIDNTGPTAHNSGGPTGGGWLEWGASAGNIHTSGTMTGPNHGAFEIWYRYAANPAANLTLCCWTPNSGSSGDAARLILRTDGKLQLDLWIGSVSSIVTATAPATGVWHQAIAQWGSTVTRKIRVDKADNGTPGSSVNSSPAANESFRLHGRYNGSGNTEQTGAVDIAAVAFFAAGLTDARYDAHYDAAAASGSSGTGSLTLSASGAAAAIGAGSGALVLSGSGTPDAAIASGAGSLTLSGSGAAVGAAAGSGSLTLSGSGSAVMSSAGTASIELTSTGEASPLYITDTSNANNGRSRGGRSAGTITRPVAPPPPGKTFGKRYDKAIAYPTPDMVDGRPT